MITADPGAQTQQSIMERLGRADLGRWLVDSVLLAELVRASAAAVCYTAPAVAGEDQTRRLRFGARLDARPVNAAAGHDGYGAELHPETVAAYIAKYATKAAGDLAPGPDGGNPHLCRLRGTLARLARQAMIAGLADPDHPYDAWGRWGDTLGFRGHFATKSRRYSVTLRRLRQTPARPRPPPTRPRHRGLGRRRRGRR